MNFLEKDLETIIWENYERCAEKGLEIHQDFYAGGKSYRQLNLAPYGIADLIYLRYVASNNAWYGQIIELKKGKVDTAAYMQAKRYQTALLSALERANRKDGDKPNIYLHTVLIGNELEKAGDFVFCLNADVNCRAFLYTYGFDGIQFEEVEKEWRMTAGASSSALEILSSELFELKVEKRKKYWQNFNAEMEAKDDEIQQHGDWTLPLVITPDGILVNEDLLGQDLEEALENGDE